MAAPTVVILAAGEGTRMRSKTPKMLHDLCGRPLVEWSIAAATDAGAARVVVVDGPKGNLDGKLPEGVERAIQEAPNGTGDAVRAAADFIDPDAPAVILMGDVPLVTPEFVAELTNAHQQAGVQATMATMILEDPTGYGRVVRSQDGLVLRVAETKVQGDATADEMAVKEVNTGIFCFDGGALLYALEKLEADNAQGEYYLPDVLPLLREAGFAIAAHVVDDHTLTLGVNDRSDLAKVREHAQRRILDALMRSGVSIVAPEATVIDATVTIGPDAVVEQGCTIRGTTAIGAGAQIGPHTTLVDAQVGDGATVRHAYVQEATIGENCAVGPFAYLRPGTVLREKAKVGTFVEVKNSHVGAASKIPHLSYIGDADIGEGSNLGAATITANYDGRNKHRTTVGDGVRTSVDTTLVAPVTLGDGSFTGAGSVITDDVPAKALGIARERQRNIEGYADRRREQDAHSGH
jgi:bifunctional UDP-N-acetylglucosamine pyrophosphorylase/glucosamine-1-phosphate N-acetyltransferase